MLKHYGIEGAAAAWTARVALDAFLLFAIAMRFLPDNAGRFRRMGITLGVALTILALATLVAGIVVKGLFPSDYLTCFCHGCLVPYPGKRRACPCTKSLKG